MAPETLTLFLCGDVMTGRGMDQVFGTSVDPRIHEPVVHDARRYVKLAEAANGPIPDPVEPAYVWGDALTVLERRQPAARIVNLESAVTTHDRHWTGKGIHYRMHPRNVQCLTAAGIDCCSLANNHALDWERAGLRETLDTLSGAGIRVAGAGRDRPEASAPAVLEPADDARVLVFGLASTDSGVPAAWAATEEVAGVNLLDDFSSGTVREFARRVEAVRRPGDLVVASIHWGGNWGYEIPRSHRDFAHALVSEAGVDVVHGHSSHHPKGIEVHGGRLILYGCGDFLNDYEGIGGHERYRGDLTLMYFPTLDLGDGRLRGLRAVPMRIRRFRVTRATDDESAWLRETLTRESPDPGTRFEDGPDGDLVLRWS